MRRIKNENRGIIIPVMTFAHLVNDLYMLILPPLFPILIVAFNLNYSMMGLLMSSVLWISFVMSLTSGYIADSRKSRKPVLVGGFILFGLSVLILSLANNFIWLVVACSIMGVAQGTYHPQAVSIINFFIKKGKAAALGIHGTGGSIGHFIAPILVGFLVTVIGLRLSLLVLFIPPMLMAVLLFQLLKEPSLPSSKEFVKSFTFPFILLTIVSAIRDMVYRGFSSFLPSYFVMEGNDLFQAGVLTALMLVTGIIAQPLGGRLSDKIGRKKMFNVTLLLLMVSLVGFAVTRGVASLIFLPLIGIGIFSTYPVTFIYASELVGSEKTGTSVGFLFGVSRVMVSMSPILFGYIIDNWGFTASFYMISLFGGIAFAASIVMPETKKRA